MFEKKPVREKEPVKRGRKAIITDPNRLTDKYGRLKFIKNSEYLDIVTKGEG